MKNWGFLLLAFGAGSFVLNQVGYEFSLLMWVDNWGVAVGNGIRGGMAVLGAVLFVIGWKMEQNAPAEPAAEPAPEAEAEREAA